MSLRRFGPLCVALVLAACGDDGGSINPASGIWRYSEYAASTNTCKSNDVVTNGSGNFSVVNNGNGTLTVDGKDGTAPFTCTLSGASLSCPNRAMRALTISGTTLNATVSAMGTFSDSRNFSGTQNGSVTCSGAGCTLLATTLGATFPCTFTINFKSTWVSL